MILIVCDYVQVGMTPCLYVIYKFALSGYFAKMSKYQKDITKEKKRKESACIDAYLQLIAWRIDIDHRGRDPPFSPSNRTVA